MAPATAKGIAMSRLTLIQGLLLQPERTDRGEPPRVSSGRCRARKLKELTGQDFGRDIKAWREVAEERQPGQMPSQE